MIKGQLHFPAASTSPFRWGVGLTFLAVVLTSVASASIVDTWSGAGGAWTGTNQPDFYAPPVNSSGGSGIFYTNAAIADATNHSGNNTRATLGTTIPAYTTGKGYGLYADIVYYTSSWTPTLTLQSGQNILSGAQNITLNIIMTINTSSVNASTLSDLVKLSLDGGAQNYTVANAITDYSWSLLASPDPNFGNPTSSQYSFSWVWHSANVTEMSAMTSYTIEWVTPGAHTAFYTVEAIQAIPEPSTIILVLLSLGGCWIFARRRRPVTAPSC